MGRLTQAKSVRSLNHNSIGIIRGSWTENSKALFYYDLQKVISSFFLQKFFKKLGIILIDFSLLEVLRGIKLKLYLYYPDAYTLDFGEKNYSMAKIKRRIRLNNKYYYTKALIIEDICLRGLNFLNKKEVDISIYFGSNNNFSAKFLCFYIKVKLKQNFSLGEVIYPLLRFLKKQTFLNGYRIDCSGRFTRKQRASKFTYKGGSIPLSSLGVPLDYYDDAVILKFGVCGIKVWVSKNESSLDFFTYNKYL